MNYFGSYKKLLANAKAAMIAAIEIYNKPVFEYRDECTVILLLNAWELLLKALLSKNKQSIFYSKERNKPYKTLSWRDALKEGKRCFPDTVPYLPINENLELLSVYRDNAMHFYNAKDFRIPLYGLIQASIKNFRDILHDSFGISLEREINWQVIPIGIQPPIDIVSYISGKSSRNMTSAIRHFLSELTQALAKVEKEDKDTGRLLISYEVSLQAIKKISKADAVVGVKETSALGGPLVIKRQDPNKTHPLRQKDITEKIALLHEKRFTSYTFQAIVWKHEIKKQAQYCWASKEGVLTKFSHDLVAFIRRLTPADVEAALTDYKKYLADQRKNKKQGR